jgi:predicted kinase
MSKPFVIVVTGQPGSGKTTLAHALARRIACPALCRDEFKEGYVHTLGGSHASLGPDINARLYPIFFESIDFVVSRGISVVVEAAFQHKAWAPKLTELAERSRVAIIICSVEPSLARSRWIERGLADSARERFHGDNVARAAAGGAGLPADQYDPPHMDLPTLTVDTTDGYNPALDQVVSFAMQGVGISAL